ncbi:hypothetical protein F5X97DRAFT_323081 [Nemania serpens]|nr:hypothetical protein F5X97DRAFT_323081 [Nemania serpens]
MPSVADYLLLLFTFAILILPMATVFEILTLLLFTSAPLMARATSYGAPPIILDVTEVFICVAIMLVAVILVRTANEYLGLTALPGKFFDLLVSL